MKKLFSLALLAMMAATAMYAQSTLVATLTHDDNISMFYGTYALQQAHAAAENGDVINLSGGGFQAVSITKGLTIRGTGVLDALPTTIIGDFSINIPTTVTDRLNFEGCIISNDITVQGTLSNAYFLKDNISNVFISSSNGNMVNGTFVNCNVNSFSLYGSSTLHFVNSYVNDFLNYAPTKASATFINCVVRPYSGYAANNISSVQLVNSILWNDTGYIFNNLPSTSSAWNCVAVGPGSGSVFKDLSAKQNCKAADTDIFIDGNVGNDLTDEAKAIYLGTDGTPVGKYGGVMPWSLVPTYPQITKMNVASKTTADGKLSVEIEVRAAQ